MAAGPRWPRVRAGAFGALADRAGGTVVFVSHDRQFLRALANQVLELDVSGPKIYPGSYEEYVESTGREAPGMRSL